MERVSVRSSNIRSVGFDAESETLEVEFTSVSVYQYYGVPESVHKTFMTAKSHGSYFAKHIRDKYRYKRVR